jgi:hypothetical protein
MAIDFSKIIERLGGVEYIEKRMKIIFKKTSNI